jgi:hypothetical protein
MDHGHEMCKAYPEYVLVRKKSTSTSAPPYDFAGDPEGGIPKLEARLKGVEARFVARRPSETGRLKGVEAPVLS